MARTTTTRLTVTGLTALVLAVLAPATGAQATNPVADGCPAGYTLFGVGALSTQGYQVPARMDTVYGSFGQAPNHDGLVCGVPLGSQTTSWGGQIYNFVDNSLPAAG